MFREPPPVILVDLFHGRRSMAARYDSNHFQLLSYRIWEEYRALPATGAGIAPSSTCTLLPEPVATPHDPPTTEMSEVIGTEIPQASAADITTQAELGA
jgi:hypothetical protein